MSSQPASTARHTVVRVRDAVKSYGPTIALSGVTLDVDAGEVLGIVGHNGAGKSTLMRVLSGLEPIDSGSVDIGGVTTPTKSAFPGVRMAYQETSLAPELTVADNMFLSGRRWMPRLRWRRAARSRSVARLEEIFPGNGIQAGDYVDDLSLAGRQMVEIARATLAEGLSLLILDEPTESLTGESSARLYDFVRELKSRGVAVILISHRLGEVLSVSDRIAVLKDGTVVSTHVSSEVSEDDLFLAMGGEVAEPITRDRTARIAADGMPSTRLGMQSIDGRATEIVARAGEVIGLAGIAGQGQEEVLARMWRARGRDIEISRRRAYVPGDRQRFGILPLWNVANNLSISAIGGLAKAGIRSRTAENLLVSRWVDRLQVRGGANAAMVGLSGGNQQKVIVARAFASDATTILLDDPFRGVDVHTKAELYRLIRSEADAGRTIIWYSSENSEMQHCDRVYVLRSNCIAGELVGDEISDDRIISLSFAVSKEAVS